MNKAAISVLNSLLIDEVTAAESYKQAIRKLPGVDIKAELELLHIAHAKRAQKLKKRLKELGTNPVEHIGKGIAIDSCLSGEDREQRTLEVFEDVECNVLLAYEASLDALDETSRSLVYSELLPDQELTHNVIYTLKTGIALLAKSA